MIAKRSVARGCLRGFLIFAGISGDSSKYEITARVNPLVFWIWFGAGIMVVGTLITMLPDRQSGVIDQKV